MGEFKDIGSNRTPGPYDDVQHLKCVVCKAPPGSKCVNPVTGRPRKAPCIGRRERTGRYTPPVRGEGPKRSGVGRG